MGRKFFFGLITLLVAVRLAVPAEADTNAEERQFLAELKAAGWTINDPSGAISQGHMVCGEGLAHHVSWQEMRSTLMGYGYSRLDASTLISTAVSVFCPKYDVVVQEIQNDLGRSGSGNPTYADGDDFTKKVYNHGILTNHYPVEIVQILADICYKDKDFPKSGIPKSYIITLYRDSYGLSEKDAKWLINAALDYCN